MSCTDAAGSDGWQGGCYQYVVDFSLPWRTLQAGESAA
jgi:hypothetical protein